MVGDIAIRVVDKEHPHFRRGFAYRNVHNSSNLLYELTVPLVDALCGISHVVKGLDGNDIWIKYDNSVSNDEVIVVKEQGLPNKTGGRGDIIVKVTVEHSSLDYNKRSALYKLLTGTTMESRDANMKKMTPALAVSGEFYASEKEDEHMHDHHYFDDEHEHNEDHTPQCQTQ